MDGLVQTQERVTLRAKVYVSMALPPGGATRREEMELAQWSDGTLLLGPFLVNRVPMVAAIESAKLSWSSRIKEGPGISRENIQRVIVPSLVKDDPGVLVVYEGRPWYAPWTKPKIGLQRARPGVMTAEPIYMVREDELRAAVDRAPIQPTEPPRPGWEQQAPRRQRSGRRR